MRKRDAVLLRVEGACFITRERDSAFVYHLQNGLLLALKEAGFLDLMGYQLAWRRLKEEMPESGGGMERAP